MHTNSRWPEFLYFHPFMSDVYQLFWDDVIDAIRERALQLWLDLPNTMAEYIATAKIKELPIVPSISACMPLVLNDLRFICSMLELGVIESGKENDVVTQNMLSDFQRDIGIAKRKLEMSMAE